MAISSFRSGGLQSTKQLEAALKYLEKKGDAPLDREALNQSCGIGVEACPALSPDAMSYAAYAENECHEGQA